MSDLTEPVVPPLVAPPLVGVVVPLPDLTLEQFRASFARAMFWINWAVQFTPTGFGLRTIMGGITAIVADDDAARFILVRVNDYRAKGMSLSQAVAAIVAFVREEFDYPAVTPPKV